MKSAIIIKGNPKFISDNKDAEKFYNNLKVFLEDLNYSVTFDAGLPYTVPIFADLWVGHSRGSDRLRFAPNKTKTIAIGVEGGINNLMDKALSSGDIPDKNHYILTKEMKEKIKKIICD